MNDNIRSIKIFGVDFRILRKSWQVAAAKRPRVKLLKYRNGHVQATTETEKMRTIVIECKFRSYFRTNPRASQWSVAEYALKFGARSNTIIKMFFSQSKSRVTGISQNEKIRILECCAFLWKSFRKRRIKVKKNSKYLTNDCYS